MSFFLQDIHESHVVYFVFAQQSQEFFGGMFHICILENVETSFHIGICIVQWYCDDILVVSGGGTRQQGNHITGCSQVQQDISVIDFQTHIQVVILSVDDAVKCIASL